MKYAERRAINVNEHIEKKGELSYLSWAWAVDKLLELDETATWGYKDPVQFGDTLMVFCTVQAFGVIRGAQLPVMDHRNKAISNPDSFAVNTAMQRCLAKAIALHGIGLYIYAGEDVPQGPSGIKDLSEERQAAVSEIESRMRQCLDGDDILGAKQEFQDFEEDVEVKTILWHLFDSKQRRAMKDA